MLMHRQYTPLLQMAGEFVESAPFDHELAGAEVEAQHFIADIFDHDHLRMGHFPADSQA